MNSQELSKLDIPDLPGVYEFLGNTDEILYVGKATSLKDRLKSYFNEDLIETRGRKIVDMVALAKTVRVTSLLSVLEAMILEAKKIQDIQPYYNTIQKDNKSFNFVVITNEDFPKIFSIRERTLDVVYPKKNIKYSFGPFTNGRSLQEALKIIRRIFPYRNQKCISAQEQVAKGLTPRPCFNRQIGLCPGTCTGEISKKDYAKTINHIRLFFEGKKKELIRVLEKEMNAAAALLKFEDAQKIKKTIFALDHINDTALINKDDKKHDAAEFSSDLNSEFIRIEAYDVAHISGTSTVGVMTVVEDGELNKNEYRKFKIKGAKKGEVNDIKNLKEVLVRRLRHLEWQLPDIIVVDGSTAQINAAKEILAEKNLKNISIIALVKNNRHKARELMGDKDLIEKYGAVCMLANAEAHRFAIAYHRLLRSRRFAS